MYLDLTIKQNPRLIQVTTELHQKGVIPANTYVLDLDMVFENAQAMALASKKTSISLYFMSKHFNRNPFVCSAITSGGIHSAVAVDVQDARQLARYNIPVGHVGHLVQIPKYDIPRVLAIRPEVWTIFSLEASRFISDAAIQMGIVQDVLIRIRGKQDIIYPNEEGGIPEEEFISTVQAMDKLKGIRLVGLTTFPATLYNEQMGCGQATSNFGTMMRTAETLRRMGIEVKQLNAPGATSASMLKVIKNNGGTHGEPGHALTGTTPWLLFDEKQPEHPAMIYVNEVSHKFEGKAYLFGGGFFACDVGEARGNFDPFRMKTGWNANALVGRQPEKIAENKMPLDKSSFFGRTSNAIDWYGSLSVPSGKSVDVGDTVICGFRAQAFATRANVAVISGVKSANPEVKGIFDRGGNILDRDWDPATDGKEIVIHIMDEIASKYSAKGY